jgi:hypothetical protein
MEGSSHRNRGGLHLVRFAVHSFSVHYFGKKKNHRHLDVCRVLKISLSTSLSAVYLCEVTKKIPVD